VSARVRRRIGLRGLRDDPNAEAVESSYRAISAWADRVVSA
jgi:hypothetical protein